MEIILEFTLTLNGASWHFTRPDVQMQGLFLVLCFRHCIERFSNDCRRTKTNYDRGKQPDQPITVPSNFLKLAQGAGKITRTWRDWFWFCFSLAEKLARVLEANH